MTTRIVALVALAGCSLGEPHFTRPPDMPPDAAADAAVDAAAPPAPAAPPVATDVVAIDAGIPDARPARPHRASTRRPVEHAPPTDPASHEPVDRGD
ncbi:MAG: hypothetical protein E6J91_47280 [Deltaproteobacteria bacterium]|nr:MAG: hypothetical protein E6J91_47280 [Deltaproteobacteria bacterium]